MKKYGTVAYDEEARQWVIKCEPHVSARLKRTFARLSSSSFGEHRIGDTIDTGRDLEWFLLRYPCELTAAAAYMLRKRADQHRQRQESVENILSGRVAFDSVELALPLRQYQQQGATMARRMRRMLLADDVGIGKQQPVDALVLTPGGYRRIGDLRVGDHVIGSDGRATTVTGVFPQGVRQNYRMHLSDGSSVESGDEHLWTVAYYVGGRRLHEIVVTTEQLRTGATIERRWPNGVTGRMSLAKTRVFLPILSAPVEFDSTEPRPVPPYTMGLLLANGAISGKSAVLTMNAADWQEARYGVEREGLSFGSVHTYGRATRATILGLIGDVRETGMDVASPDKRIPVAYMRAPIDERVALFHGLMDGDGSCSATGSKLTYHSTSRALAEDVRALVEQLGGTGHVHEYDRSDEGKPTEYHVQIRLPPSIRPFRVTRKLSRYAPRSRINPTRSVVGIEPSREVESICIRVDAEDSLYVTEHAILTHNTATAIGTIAGPEYLPALVVTLTHLTTQWKAEIEKFAPSLKVHILKKGTPYPIEDPPDVFVSNYHKLGGWAETLAGQVKSLVLDECQELRTGGGVKYSAAQHISSEASLVLGLSATPIYNQGSEFHAVAEVIRPDCLGSRTEFVREWCNLGTGRTGTERIRDPQAFGEYVREVGLMLRRTRAEVGRELPALTRVPQHIDADLGALDEVSDACRELALFIVGHGAEPKKKTKRAAAAGAKKMNAHFLASGELDYKLRQATGIAKAPFVAEFVRLLVEQGEQVVLYGWHREVYRIWMERLANLEPRLYTGSESPREKDRARDDFLSGKCKVLVMSLRAGAGLDGLQKACRTIVFGELDWSYGVHEQAEGRVSRDGQIDPVFAYYLTANVGSDPIVMDMLGIKRSQLEGIRDPKQAFVSKLQTDPDRIKKLAEAYLEQRVTRRKGDVTRTALAV